MELINGIKTRRSIRKYKKDDIPQEIIEDLIDCARKAPSGCNTQPWAFVIVKDKKKLQALSKIHQFASFVANAPLCIVACLTDEKVRFTPSEYLSVGCAAHNILLAAHDHGLGCCWTYVKDFNDPEVEKKARRILNLPKDVEPICMIPIGYPDEEHENRNLKATKDIVHREEW